MCAIFMYYIIQFNNNFRIDRPFACINNIFCKQRLVFIYIDESNGQYSPKNVFGARIFTIEKRKQEIQNMHLTIIKRTGKTNPFMHFV